MLDGTRVFEEDTIARALAAQDADATIAAKFQAVAEELGASVDTVAYSFLLRHPVGLRPITGSGKLVRGSTVVPIAEAGTQTQGEERARSFGRAHSSIVSSHTTAVLQGRGNGPDGAWTLHFHVAARGRAAATSSAQR